MIDFSKIDFSTFEDVPPPVRYYDRMRMSINSVGHMVMNRAFLEAIEEQREFRIRISPDGRSIALYPNGREDMKTVFSPKGCVKHGDLAETLGKKGIQFPVRYSLHWNEEEKAWSGCSEDLPAPPSVSELLPKKRKRRQISNA